MEPSGDGAHPSNARSTILLAENDRRSRTLLGRALRQSVNVLEAEDGAQVLALLDERGVGSGVDLLLIDYLLPGQSGLEVLRMARVRWPSIPAVLMTGAGSEDLAIAAFRAGARDYLKKPIDLKKVIETVRALVGGEHSAVEDVGDQPDRAPAMHAAVRRAVAFAEQHFADSLTLGDVARAVALSKFHFCRLFHEETRLSFRDYLRGLRIGRAKTLLANSRLTVTEVAYAVGFNDLSHFDKVFSRLVGVTPSRFRRSSQQPPTFQQAPTR